MTTAVFLTGFEHGVTPVTDGGGLANTIWGTPGTEIAIEGTIKRTGNYSLKIAPTATTRGGISWTIPTANTGVARFYIYIGSAPASVADVCHFTVAAGGYPCVAIDPTDGKFHLFNATGHADLATGPSYSLETWHRVDYSVDISANPWSLKCKIDGGTEFSASPELAASTFPSFRFGTHDVGPAMTLYFDDLVISETILDYPIGVGQVDPLLPTSDGTHNNGANVLEDAAGNDIDGSSYYAYEQINEVPMSGTATRIQQSTAGTANYVVANFADVGSYTAYHGVKGILAYMSEATQANKGGCVVRDGAGTETALWGSQGTLADYSETSMQYKSAVITVPAGGWTQASINALTARIGYSSDVNPVPYWENVLLEVAHNATAPGGATHHGAATLNGIGALATRATYVGSGHATLPGVSTMSIAGRRVAKGTTALPGVAAIAASGQKVAKSTAALQAMAALAVNGQRIALGTTTLAGIGALSANGTKTLRAFALLPGIAALIAEGRLKGVIKGEALLAAIATLDAAGQRTARGDALLAGIAALDVDATKILLGQTQLSGVAGLSVNATKTLLAQAQLSGIANLSVEATKTLLAQAQLSGIAGLDVGATKILLGQAQLSALAELIATGTTGAGEILHAITLLAGEASLSVRAMLYLAGLASLIGEADLTATGGTTSSIVVAHKRMRREARTRLTNKYALNPEGRNIKAASTSIRRSGKYVSDE